MLLLIIGAFITLTAMVVITNVRGPGGMNDSNFAYMSETVARRASRVARVVGGDSDPTCTIS